MKEVSKSWREKKFEVEGEVSLNCTTVRDVVSKLHGKHHRRPFKTSAMTTYKVD